MTALYHELEAALAAEPGHPKAQEILADLAKAHAHAVAAHTRAAALATRAENVAELLAHGEDVERIAARLGVHCRTVQRHIARIRTAERSTP